MPTLIVQPFCRVAGHTSEEIREVLATLETVFQPLLPPLNLRRWTGSIYDWLTQSVLDPTNSGRVTMDILMKLVLAALEWSYEAKATDVQEKWLEQAAELLVLRHDTFEIIDGEKPEDKTEHASGAEKETASEISAQQVASPNEEQERPPSVPKDQVTQARSREKVEEQPAASGNCTFSGNVPIARKPLQAEWCLGSGVSWLWESMEPFARRWSAALQSATQTENEHSQCRATVGQGGKGNRLECGRRVRKLAC